MTLTQDAPGAASRLRTLAGAIVVATITGCGLSLTIALLALRLHEAGYSAHAVGINTAAGGVATLLCAPVIPRLARRFGVARLLLFSLLLGAGALVAFTLTEDFTAWLLLRFVTGFSVTAMFILSEFWITTSAPPGRSGLAIAAYVTSLAVGFALGPIILTLVGANGPLPFYLGALLFVGGTPVLLMNAADAPEIEEHSSRSFLFFIRHAPAATLSGLLHGCIEVAGLSLLPVYALQAGADARFGALLASLFVLGNSALQVPIGLIADRFDRGKLLLLLALAASVGAVFLALHGLHSAPVFCVVLFLWGGIVGAFYPVGLGQLGESFRGADLASANAAFIMTYAAGMLIGPPLVGEGLDLLPAAGFFWTTGAMALLYVVVVLGGRGLAGFRNRAAA